MNYELRWKGHQRDDSRMDAHQARFQLYRERSYFQFVVAVLAGIDLVLRDIHPESAPANFWRAVALEAVDPLKNAIRAREIPLHDARFAYEVFPSVDAVQRNARKLNKTALSDGEVVARFVA